MSNAPIKINTKDVAREALRALVERKLDPSPENYTRLYNEIAGLAPEVDGLSAEAVLGRIASGFPRTSPELLRIAEAMDRAGAERDWAQYANLLHEATGALSRYHASTETWRTLLADLLRQLDVGHKGLTRGRKKERLERMLEMPSSTPEQLQQKLGAIVKGWTELSTQAPLTEQEPERLAHADAGPRAGAQESALAAVPAAAPAQEDVALLCELLAQVLEIGLSGLLAFEPALATEAEALARQARAVRKAPEMATVRGAIKSFLFKVDLTAANTSELHQGMLRLLRLVIRNIAELVGDDQWLQGQISVLIEIISKPLDLAMIEQAERGIKDAVLRQGTLRHSLTEATTAFKSMVSGFIERLSGFSSSTADYHEVIERLSVKIRETDDIIQLGRLLDQVAVATRSVQTATLRSRDETLNTQRAVQSAEDRIRDLQSELMHVSSKVREDQLTGALNRRGLDEEYARACAAADRRNEPLSLALLDIDDFKALNDGHGHIAGDSALVHLAKVISTTVRPTDIVCRYGGEEFVVLLPETSLEEAVIVMSRLQREITKRFFLHDNQRLLITFSAGVAQRRAAESQADAIARADAAMYSAKRAGKNRVMFAD